MKSKHYVPPRGRRIDAGPLPVPSAGFRRLARESSLGVFPSSRGRLAAAPIIDIPATEPGALDVVGVVVATACAGVARTGGILAAAPRAPPLPRTGAPPRGTPVWDIPAGMEDFRGRGCPGCEAGVALVEAVGWDWVF